MLGPHAVGGKDLLPGLLAPIGRLLGGRLRRSPVPIPALVPDLPVQFVHEDDVGRALVQCVVAAGPPGAYNIAGDGVLSLLEVAREFGIVPIALPARPAQAAARWLSGVPHLPAAVAWTEAFSHPAVMDTNKAKGQLGWEPEFTGLEALRDTLGR